MTSLSEQQQVYDSFDRLHQRGLWSRTWTTLTGKSNQLMRLDEFSRHKEVINRSHAGIQVIPIEHIRGTEGRDADFDAQFRPLSAHNRERWAGIAKARNNDVALPAVELVEVDSVYFIRDGHHRISVAKSMGQMEIEAAVTRWHCAPTEQTGEVSTVMPIWTRAGQLTREMADRLATAATGTLTGAGGWIQALTRSGRTVPVPSNTR
jgi:hypothetical protein